MHIADHFPTQPDIQAALQTHPTASLPSSAFLFSPCHKSLHQLPSATGTKHHLCLIIATDSPSGVTGPSNYIISLVEVELVASPFKCLSSFPTFFLSPLCKKVITSYTELRKTAGLLLLPLQQTI